MLRTDGKRAARRFLDEHFDDIGAKQHAWICREAARSVAGAHMGSSIAIRGSALAVWKMRTMHARIPSSPPKSAPRGFEIVRRRHHDACGRCHRQRGQLARCWAAAASMARSIARPDLNCSPNAARSAAARPAGRRSRAAIG